MFESSTQYMDEIIATSKKWANDTKQFYKTRKTTAEQRMKAYNRILEDSNASSVEHLRAIIGNVIESSDLHSLTADLFSLHYVMGFAIVVRMFQEEVALQLNLLRTQIATSRVKGEEPQKYAKMKKDLQKIKRTINKEWKPLMETLRDEIEKRRKFLNENR